MPLLALGLLILFKRSTFWIGIWPETGAAVGLSAFFISLFGASLSAWAVARSDRYGLVEQAASGTVRPYALEANSFLANVFWLVLPYLSVCAVAFALTAASAFPAGVWMYVAYTTLGLILVLMSSAWGWFLGRLLDPIVAALVAALSWFILVSTAGNQVNAAPVSGPPWVGVNLGVIAVRLASALVLALAVCALPRRKSSLQPILRRRAYLRGTGLTLAAAITVVTAHVYSPVLTRRAPVAAPLCIQGAMQYCLWPEDAKYVPLIREADSRVAALPLTLPLPKRVVDYSLSGATRWVHGVEMELPGNFSPEFDISEGSRWALARGLASAITTRAFASCRNAKALNDPEDRWDQLQAWLESRLAGGGARDYSTNAPEETQHAWGEGYRVAAQLTDAQQATWAAHLIQSRTKRYCSNVS